jgi:polyribonucleotide nucleotidyltransferase
LKKITNFGAFVEFLPGKEGLLHISQIALERVERVEDYIKVGNLVEVKLLGISPDGKYDLSRKVLLGKEKNDHK